MHDARCALYLVPTAGLLPEVAPETPVEGNSPEAKGARENMKLAQLAVRCRAQAGVHKAENIATRRV